MNQQNSQVPFPELSQGDKRKIDAYVVGLSKFIHGPKTRGKVTSMLQRGEPQQTVPTTAFNLVSTMDKRIQKADGKPPSLEARFSGILFAVQDLLELGMEGGLFKVTEGDIPGILQSAFQKLVEAGLKDKSIDPIELQQKAEMLMTPEQRQQGLSMGQQSGVPEQPGVNAALDIFADQKVSSERKKWESEQDKKGRPGGAFSQAVQQGMGPKGGM